MNIRTNRNGCYNMNDLRKALSERSAGCTIVVFLNNASPCGWRIRQWSNAESPITEVGDVYLDEHSALVAALGLPGPIAKVQPAN